MTNSPVMMRELRQGLVDSPLVDRVEFSEFARLFRWEQGEHIGMIGPTGSGKTTLAHTLLDIRKYVTIFATKPVDDTLQKLIPRYKKIEKWDQYMSPEKFKRRILWPNARTLYAAENQHKVFNDALQKIYVQGNWCVYFDELWVMVQMLKLGFEVRVYLQQARSLGISVVAATQRPKYVPLEIYDQSSHLFFWRDNDVDNLNRISGISWLNSNHVRATVANLEKHEVLYIYLRDSDVRMMRFFPPAK